MRAMILAAGRGTRMRPLSDKKPKALLAAGGKPLIVWHMERLAQAGITSIMINHAWLGEQITALLGDGRRHGVHITYSAEPQALETGGGIANVLDFFGAAPFLVVNADAWCDWNPARAPELAASLQHKKKLAWLLLADNPDHHPEGDFILRHNGLVANRNSGHVGSPLTFTGIGIYQPALFAHMAKGQAAPLAPILRQAMVRDAVLGTRHTGAWSDIGTPERLDELNRQLRGPGAPTAEAGDSSGMTPA